MNFFDYINSITHSKDYLMTDSLSEKEYVPFLVNKGLSYFPDTILYSNEMNMRPFIDNRLAYDYYINSVRPRKRYSKWHKREKLDHVEVLMEYYECSYAKALDYAKVLNDEQIKIITKSLTKGG